MYFVRRMPKYILVCDDMKISEKDQAKFAGFPGPITVWSLSCRKVSFRIACEQLPIREAESEMLREKK